MGLLEKSKLAKNAYEEGHRVDWDEVRIWEIESDSKYTEHKDIRPYGVFKKFDQTTQPEDFSHMYLPYQPGGYQLIRKEWLILSSMASLCFCFQGSVTRPQTTLKVYEHCTACNISNFFYIMVHYDVWMWPCNCSYLPASHCRDPGSHHCHSMRDL
jgi:hypothetical protein